MISKFLVACSYICSYSQIINPGLSTLANLLRHGSIIYMTLVLSYYVPSIPSTRCGGRVYHRKNLPTGKDKIMS